METTRPAHEADREDCAALLTQALAETRRSRGGATLAGATTAEELLERWLPAASSESMLYAGEFHRAVVGLGAVTTFTRPGATGPSGRIECCYVEAAARGVGVGSALMESMVAWCHEKQCRDVDALALPGDRLTKQRLEAAGFTARLLVLNRLLN
jgi:GNAT superfamily N-acetyltransferase